MSPVRTGKWGEGQHVYPSLQSIVVAGAAAGNITVTGIKKTDSLMTVINLSAAGANLVDEFSIIATNTINNAGGTNTTGMLLLVQWYKAAVNA